MVAEIVTEVQIYFEYPRVSYQITSKNAYFRGDKFSQLKLDAITKVLWLLEHPTLNIEPTCSITRNNYHWRGETVKHVEIEFRNKDTLISKA